MPPNSMRCSATLRDCARPNRRRGPRPPGNSAGNAKHRACWPRWNAHCNDAMSDLPKRHRSKEILRQIAIELCSGLLQAGSKPYQLQELPTVVIAPHQDDETLACGGVIARKRSEGLPVHVIFITDGSASHPGHPRLGPPA